MIATTPEIDNLILTVTQEIFVNAPLEVTFESLLEQIGPENDTPEGNPLPMKIEPWPGGRWYRDLGEGNGHLWAHVQAIKRPTLLEFTGPLFMSYPVVSNAVPAQRAGRRNFNRVSAPGAGTDSRPASARRYQGLDAHS